MPNQPQPIMLGFAIRAWNRMGSQIDYSALPAVAEMLGVDDMELLIDHLQLIKSNLQGQNG